MVELAHEVIFIVGLPVSGKTYLTNQVRAYLGCHENKQFKLLKYEQYLNYNYIIIGSFTGEMFEGTDKLSMAVQPDMIEFIKSLDKPMKIIIEGDRLFTESFIKFLENEKIHYQIIILKATPSETIQRYRKRGRMQTEKFLKGRATKLQNIIRTRLYKEFFTTLDMPEVMRLILN